MAPTRNRNNYDESRFDPSSSKDKNGSSSSKARRNHNAAVAALASSAGKHGSSSAANTGDAAPGANMPGIVWSRESIDTLHVYRSAHRVNVPLAFKSEINQAVLTMPGIGAQSPTMARRKDKRKISKDQEALAVRKHFNSQAISETDVVVEFLYKVKNQDEAFKLRFSPQTPR